MKCQFCKRKLNNTLINLGKSPLANAYQSTIKLSKKLIKYELKVLYCKNCWLFQLSKFVKEKKIFNSNYAYFSSFSNSWLNHSKKYVKNIIQQQNLSKKSFVVEIASNDGYLLKNFVLIVKIYFSQKKIQKY